MKRITYFLIGCFTLGLSSCASDKTTASTNADNVQSGAESPKAEVPVLRPLSLTNLPTNFIYKGKPTQAYQFTDKAGEHILVVAETGEVKTPKGDEDARDKDMNVYHLLKNGDTYTEVWKAQDYIRNCQFDLILEMRPESMEVTDLDKDGIAEISFVYFLTCISDVSPYDMKLLMYEGTDKYAVRGTAKLVDIPSQYTLDAAFNTAPAAFSAFAKEKWRAFEDQAAG